MFAQNCEDKDHDIEQLKIGWEYTIIGGKSNINPKI